LVYNQRERIELLDGILDTWRSKNIGVAMLLSDHLRNLQQKEDAIPEIVKNRLT